jgi:hypothetical protein
MDPAEQERADAWFRDKWRHGRCPVCNANTWDTLPKIGQIENLHDSPIPPFGGQPFPIYGRVPVLLVGCQNCGYLVPINALVAGIRQPPTQYDPEDGRE